MEIIIKKNRDEAGAAAAGRLAEILRKKPDAVLGLATGSTPLTLYQELIRLHREEGLDFSGVTTFNLDEYIGLPADHEQSYHRFMQENFFSRINIRPENVHIPDGMAEDIPSFCAEYEQAIRDAGGLDLQVLGIGSNGHIGFNEPGSSFVSRTRIQTLARQTLADNALFFGGDESRVPRRCITMGIGTIMEAGQIMMLSFGRNKADAVTAAVEGPVAEDMPASILQHHPCVRIFLDEDAASKLKRADYYRRVCSNKPAWQEDVQ